MNAPDRVTTWFPRAGSLAERVLAWLPLQPCASATAVQIAAALGVTRAARRMVATPWRASSVLRRQPSGSW